MQRDAQAVANWAELNGLELNLKKSKVMLLGSKTYVTSNLLNINNFPSIKINNNPLQYVKFLIFKESWPVDHWMIDWKSYVEHILKKVNPSLASLHFYR